MNMTRKICYVQAENSNMHSPLFNYFCYTYHYLLRMRVKIGATRRFQRSGFAEIDVARIIKHPRFRPEPSYDNDIGLLILERPFPDKGSDNLMIILFEQIDVYQYSKLLKYDKTVMLI